MLIHSLANQELVIGLNWMKPGAISNTTHTSRINRKLRKSQPTPVAYATIATRDGIQPGVTSHTDEINKTSAAAWLAAAKPSIILVEKLEEEKYWLCAIEDGTVFPVGDIVGNKDIVSNRLAELQIDTEGSDIPYVDTHNEFDVTKSLKTSFKELVAGTKPPEESNCRPLRTRDNRTYLLTVATASVIAIVGYGGWLLHDNYWGRSQNQVRLHQVDSTTTKITKERNKIQNELSQDSGALIVFFIDLISDRPLHAAGWKSISYRWSKGEIEAKWSRLNGNLASISTYLRERDWEFDESSGIVTERINFPAPKHDENIDLDSLLGGIQNRYRFLDLLAISPGTWSIGSPQKQGNFYPVKLSALASSGEGLSSVHSAVGMLRKNPVNLTEFTVNLDKKIHWNLVGSYYEKST